MKVVIAAAMWNNPHMLVLDEPTNYLDRESLGALAGAIKDYGGGVIMITHNSGASIGGRMLPAHHQVQHRSLHSESVACCRPMLVVIKCTCG